MDNKVIIRSYSTLLCCIPLYSPILYCNVLCVRQPEIRIFLYTVLFYVHHEAYILVIAKLPVNTSPVSCSFWSCLELRLRPRTSHSSCCAALLVGTPTQPVRIYSHHYITPFASLACVSIAVPIYTYLLIPAFSLYSLCIVDYGFVLAV